MDLFIVSGMAVFVLAGPFYYIFLTRLLRILREEYPDTFEELGSPSVFENNSLENNWWTLRFVMTSRCHDLGDRRISSTCRALRLFLIGAVAWAVIMTLYSVFSWYAV